MRFHVVSLPHTHTLNEFSSCAYTIKVINFCRMMKMRGHVVYLYSGDENDAPCDEHVSCITEAERIEHFCGQDTGPYKITANFDNRTPGWKIFNGRAIDAIKERSYPDDFLCLIGGNCQQPIAEALPNNMAVEFGIGYAGVFSSYRVFESYAWMHMHYGARFHEDIHATHGQWWDAVIPGYLDPDTFPFETEKDDYYMFIGRLVEGKGFQIAVDVCQDLGKRLVVCGQGEPPRNCDYRGVVGPKERGRLMSKAKAVFVPTIYVEPFGNVNIEAQACGTPVITTDWGAFTETVVDGVTGFRCHTFGEFKRAAQRAGELDPYQIRRRVVNTYSLDAIAKKYEEYFSRLASVKKYGWDEGRDYTQLRLSEG